MSSENEKMYDPGSKMNVYAEDKQWKGNESNIHDFLAVETVTSALHLLISVFDRKKKDYASLLAHRDYLLIDAHWC